MKISLKYIFNFIVTALILVIPILFLKPFLENYYTSYKNQRVGVIKKLNPSPDVIILGSSHADAINENLLQKISGKKIVKFNRGGQDLFEMIYIIKSVNKISENNTFIVTISPFTFHYDNHAFMVNGKRKRREIRIELYSAFTNYGDFINRDLSNLLFSIFHPVVNPDHLEHLLPFKKLQGSFNCNDKKLKDTNKKYVPESKCHPEEKKNKLNQHAVKRVKSMYDYSIQNMQKNTNYKIQKRSFEKFYQLCSSLTGKNTFILFTPPYWSDYYQLISNDIKIFIDDSIKKLATLPNVHCFDFSEDKYFASQPCLFLNSDHFNKKGQKLFTLFFFERLNNNGIDF